MWKPLITFGCVLLVGPAFVLADVSKPTREAIQFFESKVRPLLATHCYKCHGPEKQQGKLRLDSRAGLIQGGETAPAIVVNSPSESLLVEAIKYQGLEMPPDGKLKESEVEILTAWIAMGAPWTPGELVRPSARDHDEDENDEISAKDRQFWSFRPIVRPSLPMVRDSRSIASPVDVFIRSRQELADLRPSSPATRRELIRRAYFDLVGLPPSPSQVDAFVADGSPDAYTRLIDRLLASPQYGQRWGRHWLDVVRYAESDGYERDNEKLHAWRFRDYVVTSLNEDKPYDRFVQEQLAGDELDDVTHKSIIATGFYRIGAWDDEPDDKILARHEELDDIVSTIGSSLLGLTIGCARCHEHKFDPISQEDYYRFIAFVQGVAQYGKDTFETHWQANPDAIFTPLIESDQQARSWLDRKKQIQDEVKKLEAEKKEAEDKKAEDKKAEDKKSFDEQIKSFNEQIKQRTQELQNPPFGFALSVRGKGAQVEKTFVLIRGNPLTPSVEVEPAFLTVLDQIETLQQVTHLPPRMNAFRHLLVGQGVQPTSGRRRQLAEWITDKRNPLTARVMANRLWHYHFGRGIVATPSDFGSTGLPPSHPELLDWLAAELMDGRWHLKRMHKLIMLSSTYQQSSRIDSRPAVEKDAENRLFWRQNMRRLEAEVLRDSILSVAGQLNPAIGGQSVFPVLPAEVLATQSVPGNGWKVSAQGEQTRRSVYIFIKRTLGVPFLETFDMPTPDKPEPDRPTTTIAPQALILLNSEFVEGQSLALAERLVGEVGTDPIAQINHVFRLALGRSADDNETRIAVEFLQAQRIKWQELAAADSKSDFASRQALKSFCQLIFNMNEFAYID